MLHNLLLRCCCDERINKKMMFLKLRFMGALAVVTMIALLATALQINVATATEVNRSEAMVIPAAFTVNCGNGKARCKSQCEAQKRSCKYYCDRLSGGDKRQCKKQCRKDEAVCKKSCRNQC